MAGKKVLVVIDENEADVENKLRQTTLSQAFKNEQQTDSDLQQSLKEFYFPVGDSSESSNSTSTSGNDCLSRLPLILPNVLNMSGDSLSESMSIGCWAVDPVTRGIFCLQLMYCLKIQKNLQQENYCQK
jgi:hypothetical protein